jgi:UTP--glucose-1-phosphate uridylyltransferase
MNILIKAVITAAGRGTRLLPLTKSLPKEMLPIFSTGNKNKILVPLLQHIFEELYEQKFRDYCIVVGREQRSIKDHFTYDDLQLKGVAKNYQVILKKFYKKIEKSNLLWINQKHPLGFGDAVRRTEKFVGNDDMILHAGDFTVLGHNRHPVSKMIDTVKNNPDLSCVLLCKKVKDTKRYGVLEIKKNTKTLFEVKGVEEKPDKPKSNYAIMPLYYFKPIIFKYLKKIKKGKGGEYQLTDAIQKLIEDGGKVVAIPLLEKEEEIDIGTPELYKKSLDFTYAIK